MITDRSSKWLLFGVAALALLLGLNFLELASDVREGDTAAFDTAVFEVVRDVRTPVLTSFFLVVTHLGSFWLLLILTIGTIVGAWLAGQRRMAVMLAVAMSGAPLLSVSLKLAYARARPAILEHLVEVRDLSFPSGHALASVTFYVTVALLVWAHLPRRAMRLFLICYSLFIGAVVAASRVYLGVHWPSDVAGGAMIGLGWSLAVLLLDVMVRKRGWAIWRRRPPRPAAPSVPPEQAPHLPP